MSILEALVRSNLGLSRAEAKRFIYSGLVSQGKKIFTSSWQKCDPYCTDIIRVGKRRIEFLDV